MKDIKNYSELSLYISNELIAKEFLNKKSNLYVAKIVKINQKIAINILNAFILPYNNNLNKNNITIDRLRNEVFILMRTDVNFEEIECVNSIINFNNNIIKISTSIEDIYANVTTENSELIIEGLPESKKAIENQIFNFLQIA